MRLEDPADLRSKVSAMRWEGEALLLIDQRYLPHREVWIECADAIQVAEAIREMVVRGAPAIGAAAAYGLALEAAKLAGASVAGTLGPGAGPQSVRALLEGLEAAAARLRQSRPTAVNLFWAIDRVMAAARAEGEQAGPDGHPGRVALRVRQEAEAIAEEDRRSCLRMAQAGVPVVEPGSGVLTICNTGALATAGIGTALGVIRGAQAAGLGIRVYACETRPYLQGARLTTWECLQDAIPVTLITDSMAGYVMRQGLVRTVLVGADRIAANGDFANKIGTYTLAVLAREHGIPFYTVAPLSTVDLATPSGEQIPIEQRSAREVTHLYGQALAPEGVDALHPAFDVTPARYLSGIITDGGLIRPPFEEGLRRAVEGGPAGRRSGGSACG